MSTNTINRRKFIRQAGIASASLAIGFNVISCTGSQPEGIIELFKVNVNEVANGLRLNPFVFIEKTGAVTIFNHRPDMGQGTFQSVPILIAEELDIDLDKITIRQAPGNKEYGQQGVGGSTSMRTMWEPMRKMGAAAREMLVQAAAEQWKVSPVDCQTDNGFVRNAKTGEKLSYGDLVEAANQLEVPKEPKLKAASEYRMIGKFVPKPSVNLKVTGKANFGLDMKKEGMVFALIERCPTFNGTLKSLDDSETMKVKGVQKVLKTIRKLGVNEWEGVAVIADSYYAALKGKRALKIEWDDKHTQNTEDIFKKIREKAENEEGQVFEKEGNFNRAFAKATTKMEATYETPFLAHAAMEPQNVLVDFRKDEVEIWAPTQFPQWAMRTVAQEFGIDEEKVKVHVSFLGGGFGRRSLPDVVMEGATLSKELGKPVKVVWTREDDIQQSPMRPGSVNVVKGGLDENGKLVAFNHKVVTPYIGEFLFGEYDPKKVPGSVVEPIGEAFYDVPNFRSEYVHIDTRPIPLVWWRSVYSSTNVFAQEVFIDELARAAGKDPVKFRLDMLDGHPKYKRFLKFLAEKANWDKPLAEGKGRGIAMTHCFHSTTGHVVEISKNADGKVQIDKVVTAIDCGIAVAPDNVKAQCEGCVVMGLTAALKDPILFENGRVKNSNYHDYRVLRIHEMPKELDVHIFPSEEPPTGAGEPALPPIAPALVNAIFDLTGKRIRKLPFDLGKV